MAAAQGAIVLHQPFQGFVAQIEPVPAGVAALQSGDDAQRVGVMVEAAIRRHAGVEHFLAGMAETGVAEVMGERGRLGEVLVEPEAARESAGNLRHLDRMGQAGAEMIAFERDEDLGLVGEAAEGGRMDQPVAVALEIAARRRTPARRKAGHGCAASRPHKAPAVLRAKSHGPGAADKANL